VDELRRALWLYRRCLGARLRAVLEYEADFWVMTVGWLLTQSVGIAFLWAIFRRIPEVNGWRFWDIALIYSLVIVAEGLSVILAQGAWYLSGVVNTGQLDAILVRPYSPVLQVLSAEIGMNGFGNLIVGVALLVGALLHVSVEWSLTRVGLALILLVSAVLVKIGLNLATNCAAFWLSAPYAPFPFAMHTFGELARFPLTIYGPVIRILLSVALPYAFMSFFPATAILGRGAPLWIGLLTPLVAVYCLGGGVWIFRRGLLRYESAGT
jgi:ABC-2 type transport system permease protein